ncbi:hypothetical protein BDZ89DRAFT_1140871 [Hymenopellis radicata]|nr:hypothetical protein BDZ89DRAFT_1140871 [Hymenopellis radicata]
MKMMMVQDEPINFHIGQHRVIDLLSNHHVVSNVELDAALYALKLSTMVFLDPSNAKFTANFVWSVVTKNGILKGSGVQ